MLTTEIKFHKIENKGNSIVFSAAARWLWQKHLFMSENLGKLNAA